MRPFLALVVVLCLASCSDATVEPSATEPDADEGDLRFPDVIAATATPSGEGIWDVSATISSPYDSPERYADAWRVVGPDGSVLGVRELLHDHAAEQPFTRTLAGVVIDPQIEVVTIEGRDQLNGWGGQTFELRLTDDG